MAKSERANEQIQRLLELPEDDQKVALELLWERLRPVDEQGNQRLLYEDAWAAEIKRRMEDDRPGIPVGEGLAATRAKLAEMRARRGS